MRVLTDVVCYVCSHARLSYVCSLIPALSYVFFQNVLSSVCTHVGALIVWSYVFAHMRVLLCVQSHVRCACLCMLSRV